MDEGRREFFKELVQKTLALVVMKPALELNEPVPNVKKAVDSVPADE